MRRRTRPKATRKPELSVPLILTWADAFHVRYGFWPKEGAPPQTIAGALNEKWKNVDDALRRGLRGLPGGSSLARLLAEHRDVRNSMALPGLTEARIVRWCDTFYRANGRWPRQRDWYSPVEDAPAERWMYIDNALQHGRRGLPGGSSLAQLLCDRRGVRNQGKLPAVTVGQVQAWARDYRKRTGRWPSCRGCGEVPAAPGELWTNIDQALRKGLRGLPGGSSLATVVAALQSPQPGRRAGQANRPARV
jgi:hypothetical protein